MSNYWRILVSVVLLTPVWCQTKPLTVLLVNDDGFDAPGLAAVQKAFSTGSAYHVIVAAPAQNESGVSAGITFREKINVRRIARPDNAEWYAISARPVTCVRLAVTTLLPTKPDLVLSGINLGENVGTIAFYSGTFGAAREAQILGIPAIAASQIATPGEMPYDDAARFLRHLADTLVAKHALRPGLLLNVNFPAAHAKDWKGVTVARMSLTPTTNSFAMVGEQGGVKQYESRYRNFTQGEPDSDVTAFLLGYVSITPLTLEQTPLHYREDWKYLEDATALRLETAPQ